MTADWDSVLDDLEATIEAVEQALLDDQPVPDLGEFRPPDADLPPLTGRHLARAQALHRRQARVELEASSRIVSAQLGLGELRRRRRAATAYGRH